MKKDLKWLRKEVNDYLGIEGVPDARMALEAVLSYIDQVEHQEMTEDINNRILDYKRSGWSTKGVSDEWHTFGELYCHRMMLFLSLQLAHKNRAWKSKLHHDGTMFDDSFIVGIETPEGSYTYHCNLQFWDMFNEIQELDRAPIFDGHQPEDITRLLSLYEVADDDEQLYEVRLPLPKDNPASYMLLDINGGVWSKLEPVDKYQLTREEIVNINPKYMTFATPVEEG